MCSVHTVRAMTGRLISFHLFVGVLNYLQRCGLLFKLARMSKTSPAFLDSFTLTHYQFVCAHTDKKENKISLIYKEIQMGAVAKSYMRKGFLIDEEMRKYLVIYEEAVIHI